MPEVLNDIHSRLNATTVAKLIRPRDTDEVAAAIRHARDQKLSISLSGGRHAMGGQQFAAGALHLDLRALNRPLGFDAERGLLHIEAGADWPTIIRATHAAQGDCPFWGIRQKQTGADELTLGGAIAANAHGRGLLMGPIAEDIEDLTLLSADGELLHCSRDERPELFSLVIGGYGLFGDVLSATLRLSPRRVLRGLVDVIDLDDALHTVARRVAEGCLYGDFQYAIDPSDDGFLRRGVMACYKPAPDAEPMISASAKASTPDDAQSGLSREAWLKLLRLAHDDPRLAFREYSKHYIGTHGQTYWSDTMQLSTYVPSYADFLAESAAPNTSGQARESLVIGEHYVPPARLLEFMEQARRTLRATGVHDIYGTIRSIRRDSTTFLPWAREDYACVIFNLRTPHTPEGIARTHAAFVALTDASLDLGGSFFLTYHRAAMIEQVERAYPRFREFLTQKLHYDPDELLQSNWYRHYRAQVAAEAVR